MSKTKIHEIAEAFPAMDEEQFANLEADVRKKGEIFDPIWTYKGNIIEGRSRYQVCEKLGIEPKMVELTDTMKSATELDALEFAMSHNLCRRHSSQSENAASIIKLRILAEKYKKRLGIADAPEENGNGGEEESGGDKAEKLAEEHGVNRSYLFQAKRIAEEDPKLLDKVIDGEISLGNALKELPSTKEKERKKVVEAKKAAKEAAESGTPIFDDTEVNDAIKSLITTVDARAKALGQNRSAEYKNFVKAMDAVSDAWKQWQRATT